MNVREQFAPWVSALVTEFAGVDRLDLRHSCREGTLYLLNSPLKGATRLAQFKTICIRRQRRDTHTALPRAHSGFGMRSQPQGTGATTPRQPQDWLNSHVRGLGNKHANARKRGDSSLNPCVGRGRLWGDFRRLA